MGQPNANSSSRKISRRMHVKKLTISQPVLRTKLPEEKVIFGYFIPESHNTIKLGMHAAMNCNNLRGSKSQKCSRVSFLPFKIYLFVNSRERVFSASDPALHDTLLESSRHTTLSEQWWVDALRVALLPLGSAGWLWGQVVEHTGNSRYLYHAFSHWEHHLRQRIST